MRKRTSVRGVALIAALLGTFSALTGLGRLPVAFASGCGFGRVTGTSGTTSGNSMALFNFSGTAASWLYFITPNWDPNGIYDNHPIGVWWDGAKWNAFNQDLAPMVVGTSFNFTALTAGNSPTRDVFVQAANNGNISGNTTVINDTLANNNPNAIVIVTPNWNPNGVGGTYENHPIGVYYTGTRWAIFNQDLAAMPVGAAFNVLVFPGASGDASNGTSVQTATTANTSGSITYPTPHPNAGATLFVTPNWNPPGHPGVYLNHNIGVYVSGATSSPAIFTQDRVAMPLGASFNIWAEYSC